MSPNSHANADAESDPLSPAPDGETTAESSSGGPAPPAGKRKYVRAVGPRLRIVLFAVFGLVALLIPNSLYLAGVTALEWGTGRTYQDYFYQTMFLAHLALGLALILPFVLFGALHMVASWNRRNRRAVRIGYALLTVSVTVLVTGLLLMRLGAFELKQPAARSAVYWLHVACPLVVVWLYWLHRLAGPRIKWRVGVAYAATVAAVVLGMVVLQQQDPRQWNVAGNSEGEKYFLPSLARTNSGDFIHAKALMMDHYCKECHADVHKGWEDSVHRFSSFNNPAYLASVRQTREFALKRDGNGRVSRLCAGCHDPVPFFSGAFDDPDFDDVNDPTARAGLTCTACHAITNVNSTLGNGDYTIEEPQHYPFTFSENPVLRFVNRQLVKAKPSFHKKTFMKPFHKTAEFCATCHKVHLPEELNDYKWLRGQNHYDAYLLSGVSGHGARSFYYPPVAETNCNGCHMPLEASNDFGAQFFDGAEELSVHSHLFPSANTAIAHLRGRPDIVEAHREFNEGVMRVDLFGVKEGGVIDGALQAPIRPDVPTLKPGSSYLLETIIRTVKMGHLFTQGTVDSNEVWMDVTVTSGDRVIGRSGGIDERGAVDPWSNFVNVYMLDREGNRIERRNAQDIFTPLYNKQIPPGAAQVVHYGLRLPERLTAPVVVDVKLQYRKFDQTFMDFVARSRKPGDAPIRGHEPGEPYRNDLPIMTLASDRVTFPVEGVDEPVDNPPSPIEPLWQRWNDYGIGLLLESKGGGGRGELRQAEYAFGEVERLGRYDGPLNLARVYFAEGRLDDAVAALDRAASYEDPPAPAWTIAWLTGLVNAQQGRLDAAIANLTSVLEDDTEERRRRKFDFSLDYEVINALGRTLIQRAEQERGTARQEQRERFLREAVRRFEQTLAIDAENATAHYNLGLLHDRLGDPDKASEHRGLHAKYKVDDNATDRVIRAARQANPAADHAAERLVIYSLHRPGAPGLADHEPTRKGKEE